MDGGLKIGELARKAGVTAKAIRFYERKRILPPAKRAANRYRVYSDDAVDMLRFIKQAASLGLTLAEIKDIIAIREGGLPPCAHVRQLLRDKAVELDRKLKDLVDVRRRIHQSLRAWKRRPATGRSVCPHIHTPAGRGRSREVGLSTSRPTVLPDGRRGKRGSLDASTTRRRTG